MSLGWSEFPDTHDPHRCGTAPFVPNVDGPRQHSCGCYAAHFNEQGCNEYLPNYPDDLYLQEHGCKGLEDCYNNKPKTDLHSITPELRIWPPGGFEIKEDFGSQSCDQTLWLGIVWVIMLWLALKYIAKKI